MKYITVDRRLLGQFRRRQNRFHPLKSAIKAINSRAIKKTKGKTEMISPISTRSMFLSKSNKGITSVKPPEMKKFRNVIATILFIRSSASREHIRIRRSNQPFRCFPDPKQFCSKWQNMINSKCSQEKKEEITSKCVFAR